MNKYKKVKLGEVCKSISETQKPKDSKVYPINTSDVLEGKIIQQTLSEQSDLKGQFKKRFRRDDILYSEIRPKNKRYAYVDFDDTNNYLASTKLMVIRADKEKILPYYLYLLLTSKETLKRFQFDAELRSGTFPQITFRTSIEPFEIFLPSLQEQEKILSYIEPIDKQIEVLNKINQNLEVAISLSYSNLLESLKDNKFTTGKLKDIIEIKSGKRPKNRSDEIDLDFTIPLYGASQIMGYTSDYLYDEPVILIGRVGTLGVIQNIFEKSWPSDNTLVIKSPYYEYTNQILKNINYQSYNSGSTQPLIKQSDIKEIDIKIPDLDSLKEFENKMSLIRKNINLNLFQIKKLEDLKQIVLPKLIYGEIDVSELELET